MKDEIIKKLKQLNEAKVVIKPEDFEKVSDKLSDNDIVKIVDENDELYEVNKEVLNKFIKQYGKKLGKKIYYATANKQNRDPETFRTENVDDEDYEKASREIEYGVNPEIDREDWEEFLKNDINEEDDVASDKLKKDVKNFINKLNLSQFKNTLEKINTPIEQAEVIAAFAEVIGVPRNKLPYIISTLKTQAKSDQNESIRPRMKKSELIETILKLNKNG